MGTSVLRWGRSAAIGVVSALCCVVAAAALFDGVSLTGVAAAVGATVVIALFDWAAAALLFRSASDPRLLMAGLMLAPVMMTAGLVVAAQVVPGFEVQGLWAYIGAAVLLWVTSLVLDWLVPEAPTAGQAPPPNGKGWEHAEALARIDRLAKGRDTDGLIAHLQSPLSRGRYGTIRGSAAVALGELGDPEAVPSLLELLDDDSDVVRMQALAALGKIADRKAIPGVLARLDDPSAIARSAAAQSLGELRSRDAVGPLRELFRDDEDDSVRWYAARALTALGDATPAATIPSIVAGLPWWALARRQRWQAALAETRPSS